ncbi:MULTISPECIES: precorrin-3B synthase [unclassified Saccharopolyspora]|uniref:precorrin-3B synthase n=1 Tax=unclassified Saccharopolyspora TaxID=2646250 RepID=UPI001CD198DE|nr:MULTISPECIES: precorrin-3B synthase [unclassified Saccharopolyspora]MCA1190180.1 precorrin-3B synthase [Saccharopolyspora sp. 6T]MCA1196197.1 precorrin-3B synthase [Saccharopolyspora sp. 6V]MCA1228490.1 precorrin-3B synthase [Saccharopolyspora sp. 6M]MCA1283333.1 precorrin-3B synthase [Saccharopolyspora sp. 7B]
MPRRAGPDACPGALRVHEAADGGLARVRVPGGRLAARQVRALATAAALGDGGWELTSRANVQVRGLSAAAVPEFADLLGAAGLLPSPTHERVRNVVASPRTRPGALDVRAVAVELDERLRADPELAELPGRFLFTADDGGGEVTALGADVALHPADGSVAVLLAGADLGLRVPAADAARAAVLAAAAFLAERDRLGAESWRLAELPGGAERIAGRVREEFPCTPAESVVTPGDPVRTHAELGVLARDDDRVDLALGAPLGRLDAAQIAVLAAQTEEIAARTAAPHPLRLTPWRALLLTDVPAAEAPRRLAELAAAGFLTDSGAPLAGVTACTGSPGCAKSLADVRADALRTTRPGPLPVHWAGCARRCGRPAGPGVEVLATEAGYEVGGRAAGDTSAALDAARRAV